MYFGSVRFFKNLILVSVLTLILVPNIVAIKNYIALAESEERNTQLEQEIEQIYQRLGMDQWQEAESIPVPDRQEAETEFLYEKPGYQYMYPDFYAPQPLNASVREEKVIYLTFDDGPTENTDQILEILAQQGVKATFFVNGHTDEAAAERMRKIVAQGHTLGMHSFVHDYDIIYDSVEAFLDDIYQVFLLIQENTGHTPSVFRFPGGSVNGYNHGIYQQLMAEMLRRGFVPCDWNLSAQDALEKSVTREEIIHYVTADAADIKRGFVLMHDKAGCLTTVQALEDIIERFREAGFRFAAIQPDTMPILFNYPE